MSYKALTDFPRITEYPVIAIDTETTGLDWTRDKLFGISISTPDGRDFYWDIRETPQVLQWLRKELPECRLVVNQNIRFDAHFLLNLGIKLPRDRVECTGIRAALIDEHLFSYSLENLGQKYLGQGKVAEIYSELAALFGGPATRNVQMPNLHRAPSELVAPYAMRDTRLALQLWEWQNGEIERQNLHRVHALEKRLWRHVFEMERGGINVDSDRAVRQQEVLTVEITKLQKQLNEVAGFAVNPNPSGSIKELFKPKQGEDGRWRTECGTVLETTDAGAPSLNAEALERIKHPGAAMITRLRKLLKTRDTFLGGHVLGSMRNGMVHPNINQTNGDDGGTKTGRLSYVRPALQQIPARDKEVAAMVRPIFLPDEGHGWSYGDLDQHEIRVFNHYVNNPSVVSAYRENPNLDAHTFVAELTGLPRNAPKSGGANAKQLNLAAVFSMGEGTIAEKCNLPYEMVSIEIGKKLVEYKVPGPEAKAMIETYHRMVPGVKEMAKKAKSIAKSRGYVKTIEGRHIRFPGGQFTHKAAGLIYQSTSADLNKRNIINICEYLEQEGAGARLLLNIHDEYSVSTPYEGSRKRMKALQQLVQNHPDIRIPIRLDFSELADSWWDSMKAGHIT